MPKVPEKIIPEKEVSVPIPAEPEAPPAEGTWLLHKSCKDDNCLHPLALIVDESYVFVRLSHVLKLLIFGGHLNNLL